MNSKNLKLCRYLVAAALVLEVLADIINTELSSINFLDFISYVPKIMISVALFASTKTPLMIGCGIQGFVSILNILRPVFYGGNVFGPSIILNLATAVCYVLIAVSLSQKKGQEKVIPIAIIVGIVGAGLNYLFYYKMEYIDLAIYDISYKITIYVRLLVSILALEDGNVPIVGNKFISASTNNSIETITKLKELLDVGAISQEEFDEKKKQLLNL